MICDKGVDYVVQDTFSPVTAKYLAPAMAQNSSAFVHVYSRNDTHLFQVDSAALCKGTGAARQATIRRH